MGVVSRRWLWVESMGVQARMQPFIEEVLLVEVQGFFQGEQGAFPLSWL